MTCRKPAEKVRKSSYSDHYKRIRTLLRDSEIRPELRRFLKSITKELGENRDEARLICRNLDDPEFLKQKGRSLKATSVAAGIAEWVLSAKAEGTGRGFPYDLSHLTFCLRAQRALEILDRDILPWLTGRTPRGARAERVLPGHGREAGGQRTGAGLCEHDHRKEGGILEC